MQLSKISWVETITNKPLHALDTLETVGVLKQHQGNIIQVRGALSLAKKCKLTLITVS